MKNLNEQTNENRIYLILSLLMGIIGLVGIIDAKLNPEGLDNFYRFIISAATVIGFGMPFWYLVSCLTGVED